MLHRRSWVMALACALTGCVPVADAGNGTRIDRIVSIDYCADQMLLGLVERGRIAAVSSQADSDPGFAAALAAGLPHVRADVERILALRPTLVVRSTAGGPRLEEALKSAGIAVFTLPYPASLDDVDDVMMASGRALGAQASAARKVDAWQASLARARSLPRSDLRALYMTPGDVTTGPDSFVSQLIAAAGYRAYDQRSGWNRLPIEGIAAHPPAIVVRGFFDSTAYQQDRWSSAQHDVLASALRHSQQISITGSQLACNNWLAGLALDQLVAAWRRRL